MKSAMENVNTPPLCAWLTTAELVMTTKAWNETAHGYSDQDTMPDILCRAVKQYGDNVAVTFESESLTYNDLWERANGMAKLLIERGAQPDALIALMLDRSIEMVTSIWGVYKAGAACVPIDPHWPSKRRISILEDAASTGCSILLTQTPYIDQELLSKCACVVDVNVTKPRCADAPELSITPENLAYSIFTSGSTGRPRCSFGTRRRSE